MQPRLSVITLAVANLDKMRKFYEEVLSWSILTTNQDIVFFQMNGFLLSLCKTNLLEDFIGFKINNGEYQKVSFGYNVSSAEEVRAIHQNLLGKGVKILKPPTAPVFGGLFFYFADVENNVLEVSFNPYVIMDGKGNVTSHKEIHNIA